MRAMVDAHNGGKVEEGGGGCVASRVAVDPEHH